MNASGAAAHGGEQRVTVAVPMHNGVRYLEEAVESIRAQRYASWQAVLVDDASSDGTHALACELAARDPDRISVVRLERNVGVAGARAAAIAAARPTELVALLDQDDVLAEHYLERCVALYDEGVAAGRSVGIVSCDVWFFDSSGARSGTLSQLQGWVGDVTYDRMIQRNCVCARALFSREAYEHAGGFQTETQPSDDYDLWLRMLELGYEVVTTPELLAGYRRHDGATSRDEARMASAAIVVHRRALSRGAVTRTQRRALRARIRHHRALRERARLGQALADRRMLAAGTRAARAAGYGSIAFVQTPSRWGEWMLDVVRRPR